MNKLRTLRKNKNLTQKELSYRSGVHRVSIARYEKGKISPNTDTAAKLARALGCTIDELLGETKDPNQPVRR